MTVMTEESKRNKGFILFPVLLFLIACSGVAMTGLHTVAREAAAANEFLRYRQLETIAQSFMQTALYQEEQTEITDAAYQLGSLYPGKEPVNVIVKVNREPNLGLRFLQVDAFTSFADKFSLRQCRIRFSDSLLQQFANSLFIVPDAAVQKEMEERNVSITSNTDGAVFPDFSVENIALWASTDFPSALELQRDGLSGWIYLSRDRLSLPKGITVHGNGILAFTDNIVINDNSTFTGRVILLADGNVRIGSHVRLEKALLLCRGKLTVGTDSFINGAVMTQQDAVLGEGVIFTGDREVLEPYDSIVSY